MLPKAIDRDFYVSDPDGYRRALRIAISHLRELSGFYPGFDSWLSSRVLPGIIAGERSILLENSRGALAGIAIIKDTNLEQKLCCLRVLPVNQGSGVGLRLFERAFDALQNRSPLLSVSEERLGLFSRIFKHYGFELTEEYPEFYRPSKIEYSFNGLLDNSPASDPREAFNSRSHVFLAI